MGPLLRWAGRGLLILYVVLMIVVLGLRYWIIPNIDQWRAPINQVLSNITHSDIHIGTIQAQWRDLYPELLLQDVSINADATQAPLHIPSMIMRLQLLSLFKGNIVFSYVGVSGLHLDVHRDTEQRLHIAGQAVQSTEQTRSEPSGFLQWLAQQQKIELTDASLSWHDEWRGHERIQLTQVQGILQQRDQSLHYMVTAQPPTGLGQAIRLQGQLDSAALRQNQLSGTLYTQLQGLQAEAWLRWADLPTGLVSAQLEAQVWVQLAHSEITEISLDVQVQEGHWQTQDWGEIKAQQLRAFVQGPWSSIRHYIEQQPLQQRVLQDAFDLELYAQGVQWLEPPYFAESLLFDQVALKANSQLQADKARLNVSSLSLKNADLEVELTGSVVPHATDWNQAQWDLTAQAKQIELNALYKYFPMPEIPEATVEWLRTSLVAGHAPEAVIRWQGNLHDYPYVDPSQGIFYVGAPVQQAEVDYYPATSKEKGWPKIENLDATLLMRGNQLWIQHGQSELKPNKKDAVQASSMFLAIDDLAAADPILSLTTDSTGSAQAYLGLMTHSNLGALLDNALDQTQATGDWQVPLQLSLNLEDGEQVEVAGHIEFANNRLTLLPWLPPLERLQGRLLFSEQGVEAQAMQGQWLGGPLRISKRLGAAQQALELEGQLQADALTQYAGLEGLQAYVNGDISYTAQVGLDQDLDFFVAMQSSLQGLQSSLPAPLQKRVDQTWPLKARWMSFDEKQHMLSVQMEPGLSLALLENTQTEPVFEKGYVLWQRSAPNLATLAPGLWIDIEHPQLDLDQWQEVLDSVASTPETQSSPSLIALRALRIKAEEAYALNGVLSHLTFTTQRMQPEQWRTDISSEQVDGTVQWQESPPGQVVGVVDAEFQRVHWQPKLQDEALNVEQESELELDLANLDLRIDDFHYDGLQLGRLTGLGRRSSIESSLWLIPQLSLQTPYGELTAQGNWRLAGVDRGLQLQAELQSESLGDLLDYIGFKEVLAEGQGSVQADLSWAQLPWSTSVDHLHAQFEVDIQRGRLNQLRSGTGKLLEFLSLQSISRLSSLGPDLRGLVRNGFPFDQITGKLQLTQRVLSTEGLQVVGPVGAVMLEGQANMALETIDMRAVVVPRMEMSGAALAAGIVVNPVVGLSAFLTQWLLKDPLAKAMTMQYQLSGPWDQLQTQEIPLDTVP